MLLKELVDYINNSNIDINRKINVRIVVNAPGSIGGTPCVDIKQVGFGIDWDNNTLLIFPENELTRLTLEQVNEISESVKKGNSWHSYQAYKKQKEEVDTYKKEIEELRIFIKSLDLNEDQKNSLNKINKK